MRRGAAVRAAFRVRKCWGDANITGGFLFAKKREGCLFLVSDRFRWQPLLHHCSQRMKGDRLLQIVIHASDQARLSVSTNGVCCQANDGQVGGEFATIGFANLEPGRGRPGFFFSDFPRRSYSVHDRHLHVHEDQVI